jgi:hypothetical protein
MYRLGCQGNGFSGTKRQRVFSLSKLRRVKVAFDGRSRRLKRIANALYDFHMAYKQFPVSERNRDAFDAEGKPHLSWRVHLLPMLDHAPLYDITELLTLHQGTGRTKRPDRR